MGLWGSEVRILSPRPFTNKKNPLSLLVSGFFCEEMRSGMRTDSRFAPRSAKPTDKRAALILLRMNKLVVSQRLFGKQEVLELLVERRVLASNPFEDHSRMFFFLVTIVGEDSS